MFYTLTDLRVYSNQKRELHPYISGEIDAVVELASDQVRAGENESDEVELAIDAINALLDNIP